MPSGCSLKLIRLRLLVPPTEALAWRAVASKCAGDGLLMKVGRALDTYTRRATPGMTYRT